MYKYLFTDIYTLRVIKYYTRCNDDIFFFFLLFEEDKDKKEGINVLGRL